jgi:hypothetical protein
MVWATSKIEDNGQDQKTDDGEDLDASKQELSLTVDLDGENVKADDTNQDDGNPNSRVDAVGPEVDNESSGRNFDTKSDGS